MSENQPNDMQAPPLTDDDVIQRMTFALRSLIELVQMPNRAAEQSVNALATLRRARAILVEAETRWPSVKSERF